MGKLNNYKGSVEVISGIKQANDQDFALLEANAIQVDENGKRLDEELDEIKTDFDGELNAIKEAISSLGSGEGNGGAVVAFLNIENGNGDGSIQQKGDKASATGRGAVALNGGWNTKTDGTETEGVKAIGEWSVAAGKDTTTYQRVTVAFGGGSQAGMTIGEFNDAYATNEQKALVGYDRTKLNGGLDIQIVEPYQGLTYDKSWSFAFASGDTTKALGRNSFAANQNTSAEGIRSSAFGLRSKATGSEAFASGLGSEASGHASFAANEATQAKGAMSSAFGFESVAEGENSFAAGNGAKATSIACVSMGYRTTASNFYATSFGSNTTSKGTYSFTANCDNTASATASSAFGGMTFSRHDRATTFGERTYSSRANQLVCGRYNIANSDAIFIVGNGSWVDDNPAAGNINTNARKNVFEVLYDGRAKVFGPPKESNDVVRKEDVLNCVDQATLSYNTSTKSIDMTVSKLFNEATTTYRLLLKDLPFYDKNSVDGKFEKLKTDAEFIAEIAAMTGASMDITQGLKYKKEVSQLIGGKKAYSVIGSDYIDEADVLIPSTRRGLPIVGIGREAFKENSEIESVRFVENSQLKLIDFYAFENCKNLKEIVIPESVIAIYAYAFNGCGGLTEIVIPNSVTQIGANAFNGCSGLKEIVIPESVTYVGDSAFKDCSGLIIYCKAESQPSGWDSEWNSDHLNVTFGENGLRYDISDDETYCIVSRFVAIGSRVTNLEIPSTVFGKTIKEIGNAAFKGKSNIENLLIPDSVTSIGDEAFAYCDLNSIKLSNSLTSIGKDAFLSNTGLREIVIPKSVTTIGNRAFGGCYSLTVYCEAENQPSGWDANWHNSAPIVYWYSDTYKWSQYTRYWHYVDGVPTLW